MCIRDSYKGRPLFNYACALSAEEQRYIMENKVKYFMYNKRTGKFDDRFADVTDLKPELLSLIIDKEGGFLRSDTQQKVYLESRMLAAKRKVKKTILAIEDFSGFSSGCSFQHSCLS